MKFCRLAPQKGNLGDEPLWVQHCYFRVLLQLYVVAETKWIWIQRNNFFIISLRWQFGFNNSSYINCLLYFFFCLPDWVYLVLIYFGNFILFFFVETHEMWSSVGGVTGTSTSTLLQLHPVIITPLQLLAKNVNFEVDFPTIAQLQS